MSDKLNELLELVADDSRLEPAFFRLLLDSSVHIHVRIAEESHSVRLCQFVRQDGAIVIPVFTDAEQAKKELSAKAKVLTINMRELLVSTKGATIMLNPTGTNCTLYPEEIRALLDHGWLAEVSKKAVDLSEMTVDTAKKPPQWFCEVLREAISNYGLVELSYLLYTKVNSNHDEWGWLLLLGVPAGQEERCARAIAQQIKYRTTDLDSTLDLLFYDPAIGMPNGLEVCRKSPIYKRLRN